MTGFYKPAEPTKKKVDKSVRTQQPIQTRQNKSTTELVTSSDNLVVESNFSFEDIVKKWKLFIESISREKGLRLGPALMNFNLVSMNKNRWVST